MELSKPSAYAENQNPPVIITQVELGSPLVLLSDNQSCTSPPDPKSTNNCLTDPVSGHNMACSYSLGRNTCEPLHHWTRGTNQNCLEGYPQGGAPQWFDMYNTSGMIVDLQNFTVFDKLNLKPSGSMGPFSTTLELRPHEKCTFSWLPMDKALYLGLNNMSMAISYHYDGKYYNVSTPSLSDTYNDTRTWQLDNNKWIFAQNETGVGNQLPISAPFKSTLDLPLRQFKSGTPASDVKCNDGFQLVMKSEDSSPSCVKPNTAQVLIERGWALDYVNIVGKESIILSAYDGISTEAFYNNGTVVSNFTVNVNIKNFTPSNASLVLQVYYGDGMWYNTVNVSSDMIQPDGFYKYALIAVSDKNHPPPFKVVANYNNETAITYAPVFVHP